MDQQGMLENGQKAAAGAPNATPQRLGRYQLVSRIADGGMAEVHLARQLGPMNFQKVVVVKVIHPNLSRQKEFIDMLLDEARISALIKHPRVVDIYDLGVSNGTYFIAMEYLAGQPLHLVITRGRRRMPLDVYSTARIIADAAEGLDAAHNLKTLSGRPLELVHRDVSPSNIIVLYDGGVKLVDFGVAKARGRITETNASQIKGKVGYVSPEQIMENPVDRRSDVFSLGVVLWEALALRRLFDADSEAGKLKKILDGVPLPPSAHRPEVPYELDKICLKALSVKPEERFQSAREMKQAIEDFLGDANYRREDGAVARFMADTFATERQAEQNLFRKIAEDDASAGGGPGLGGSGRAPTGTPGGAPAGARRRPSTASGSQPRVIEMEVLDEPDVDTDVNTFVRGPGEGTDAAMKVGDLAKVGVAGPAGKKPPVPVGPKAVAHAAQKRASRVRADKKASSRKAKRQSHSGVETVVMGPEKARATPAGGNGRKAAAQTATGGAATGKPRGKPRAARDDEPRESHGSAVSSTGRILPLPAPPSRTPPPPEPVAAVSVPIDDSDDDDDFTVVESEEHGFPEVKVMEPPVLAVDAATSSPVADVPSGLELIRRAQRRRIMMALGAVAVVAVLVVALGMWAVHRGHHADTAGKVASAASDQAAGQGRHKHHQADTQAQAPRADDSADSADRAGAATTSDSDDPAAGSAPSTADQAPQAAGGDHTASPPDGAHPSDANPPDSADTDNDPGTDSGTDTDTDSTPSRGRSPGTAGEHGTRGASGAHGGSTRHGSPSAQKPSALYREGARLYLAGKLDQARRKFQAALSVSSHYAPAHRGLGLIYERSGQTGRAIRSLETYLRLAPHAPDAAAIRARIARLPK